MGNNPQADTVTDAKSVLSQAPFGVCLLDEREQIIWTNSTLRDQLGLAETSDELGSGRFLDDLPISMEQHTGLCQPTHRPSMRLRMAVTPLREGIKLAAFTDVTDLTSGVNGYVDLLREIAHTDSATGLRKRSQINRDLLAEINRSRRYGNALSVVRVVMSNDFGELPPGKKTDYLRDVGVRLADTLRAIDIAGQWSENEYLLILPETDAEGARRLAEKITAVLNTKADIRVNCGVSEWQASDDASTLLARALPAIA